MYRRITVSQSRKIYDFGRRLKIAYIFNEQEKNEIFLISSIYEEKLKRRIEAIGAIKRAGNSNGHRVLSWPRWINGNLSSALVTRRRRAG